MDIKKNSMIRLSTYFEIAILSCLIVYQCHCATTTTGSTSQLIAVPNTAATPLTVQPTIPPATKVATPEVTPRYTALLQGLGAASNARAALERQLQQYRTTFEALKKAEQHDRDTCHCYNQSAVAFTAFLDKTINTFGAKQPLPFDNVTLDIGNVYDPRHAAFTAPFDGIYQVFVTIVSNAGIQLVVDILHNNVLLTKVRTGNENQWHTATNSVIVHMRKGDDIWVQHSATTDSNRLYVNEGMLTSFSGYLIHKD